LLVDKSPNSQVLNSNLDELMRLEPRGRLKDSIEAAKKTAKKVGASVYLDFLPKVLAELLKQ